MVARDLSCSVEINTRKSTNAKAMLRLLRPPERRTTVTCNDDESHISVAVQLSDHLTIAQLLNGSAAASCRTFHSTVEANGSHHRRSWQTARCRMPWHVQGICCTQPCSYMLVISCLSTAFRMCEGQRDRCCISTEHGDVNCQPACQNDQNSLASANEHML